MAFTGISDDSKTIAMFAGSEQINQILPSSNYKSWIY